MEGVFTVVFLAVIVEALIEIIDNVKNFNETSWKYWASFVAGLVLSVGVALNWNLDVFKMAGIPDGNIPWVGQVLTGLLISRGSNYVSDLIGLIPRS